MTNKYEPGALVEVFSDSGWESGTFVGTVDGEHYVILPNRTVAVAYHDDWVRPETPRLYANWAVGDRLYLRDTPTELRYLVLNVSPDQEFVKVLSVKETTAKDFTESVAFLTYVFTASEFSQQKWRKV